MVVAEVEVVVLNAVANTQVAVITILVAGDSRYGF
jgi:hypothetical protein